MPWVLQYAGLALMLVSNEWRTFWSGAAMVLVGVAWAVASA